MTRRVIESDGFDACLPTACYPERRVLRMLEGAPDSEEVEAIALDWAASEREGEEEMLVAFKISALLFKIVRRAPGIEEEGVYSVAEDRGFDA